MVLKYEHSVYIPQGPILPHRPADIFQHLWKRRPRNTLEVTWIGLQFLMRAYCMQIFSIPLPSTQRSPAGSLKSDMVGIFIIFLPQKIGNYY